MSFVTKVDLSDNRQIKERPRTTSILSGTTQFGVPFSALTSGPDYSTEVVWTSATTLVSVFTGTSASTVYTWSNTDMVLGEVVLTALTPSNSATTQNTDSVFSAWTTTTIDGNSIVLTYSGVSFDVTVTEIVELATNLYSGSVTTAVLQHLSAGTLDYTGRTIWLDTKGISRTEKLIVSDSPTIGQVLTCVDSEGMVGWSASSGGTQGVDRIDKTGAATVTINTDYDTIFLDCSSNNITATLPDATTNGGMVVTIKRTDSSAFSATLDCAGGHTIDGNASIAIASMGSYTVISDVNNWWIK